MSYYEPYYNTPRSRRGSLSYVPAPSSYHEPLVHTYSQPAYSQQAYSQTAYSQPAYSMYAASNMSSPRIASYDDLALHDPYYLERRASVGAYPPLVQPLRRRASSISAFATSPGYAVDSLRRGFGRVLKFKRKGAFRAGITIGEAQANVRLSDAEFFTLQDLGVDMRGKIYVNLRWPGYSPLNYEIPVDAYGGLADIQSLARRVGRAVSHYLQANVIPIRWDRIEMQHLEELSIGMWHLKMSAQ